MTALNINMSFNDINMSFNAINMSFNNINMSFNELSSMFVGKLGHSDVCSLPERCIILHQFTVLETSGYLYGRTTC